MMLNDPAPPNVVRTFPSSNRRGRIRVETRHPRYGLLVRGWLQIADVEDMTGAGMAGRLVWRLTNYDSEQLAQVTGDYLEATKELDQ